MKKSSSLAPVYLAAVVYATITGFSFVFTKFALEFSSPVEILAHRFLFSFTALLILLVATGRLSFFSVAAFKKVLPLAIFYPLMFFGFQTFGLGYATSAEGGILLSIAPVFTLILSTVFLKEKAGPLQLISVLLSVSGVIFIFYRTSKLGAASGSGSLLGIILLLITAFSMAVYSVMARRYTKEYENLQLLTVMITIGFIGFHLLLLVTNPTGFTHYFAPFKQPRYLVSIFYLGVLSTLGSSLLTNFVLKRLEASKMSVFANLGTLISIGAGALVLGETVYPFHLIGAGLIIVGVIGTNLGKSASKSPN